MEKPLLLKRQDFMRNLITLINESNLPLIIVEPILSNTLKSVQDAIHQEYIQEEQQYVESIKQQARAETKEENKD